MVNPSGKELTKKKWTTPKPFYSYSLYSITLTSSHNFTFFYHGIVTKLFLLKAVINLHRNLKRTQDDYSPPNMIYSISNNQSRLNPELLS